VMGGDELFERASNALTIQEVWRDWGLADCPREGNALVKSPFRPDGNASFSIYKGGRLAQDKASGDVIPPGKFAYLANDVSGRFGSKREVRERVIVLAGLGGELGRAPKPLSQAELKRRAAEKYRECFRGREDLLKVPVPLNPLPVWPEVVAEFYCQGEDALIEDADRIARDRGWPVSWVVELAGLGKMSKCPAVWDDGKRYRAFKVEQPVYGVERGRVELVPVGYHQRMTGMDIQWMYVPYAARSPGRSRLQGVLYGLQLAIPALPFVLGNPGPETRVVAITEGQWDAVALWGAVGGFHDTFDFPLVVFGLRGVEGRELFLRGWFRWLREVKPKVWLLPDNDEAGERLVSEQVDARSGAVLPSFAGRLAHWLGAAPVVTRVGKQYGKDFNDLYKAVEPGPDAMLRWMRKLGLLG
jgi:hypothetical protein